MARGCTLPAPPPDRAGWLEGRRKHFCNGCRCFARPAAGMWQRMDARSARLARNEAVFRAGNEAIVANHRDAPPEALLRFLCECGDDQCLEQVLLTRREYEEARADAGRFFVLPGHEDVTAGEVVVAEAARYLLVEKQGPERAIVERSDPRRST